MKISRIFLPKSSVFKLLSYIEGLSQQDFKNYSRMYSSIIWALIVFIIQSFCILLITVEMSYHVSLDLNFLIGFIAVTISLSFLSSYILNRNINYQWSIFCFDHLSRLKDQYSQFFNEKVERDISLLTLVALGYFNSLIGLLHIIIRLLVICLVLLFVNIDLPIKVISFLVLFFITLIIYYAGNLYAKSASVIRKKLAVHKSPDSKNILLRSLSPFVSNSLLNTVFPVSIILLSNLQVAGVVSVIGFYTSFVSQLWSLYETNENRNITNEKIQAVISFLDKLSNKYIVNESSYEKQLSNYKVSQVIIDKSKVNKSLVLRNFTPKIISNGSKTKRRLSFEFKPGLYQILGPNGIGKTTLLETLSLSKDELVEFAGGEAAIDGEPLFSSNYTLKEHRNRVVYLSKKTLLTARVAKLKVEETKYPLLLRFISDLKKEHKDKYSDGELAILHLTNSISGKNGHKVLIVDEMFSRIYEDEEQPLRSEVIKYVSDYAIMKGKVVIIVDHVIALPGTIQVKMSKNSLKLLN